MSREIMSREELCEYFGLTSEEVATLFPAPPSFTLAGREKYRLTDIDKWLDEQVADEDAKKVVAAMGKFRVADRYVREQKYEEAKTLLTEAISLDRTKADYHFFFGLSLYKLGDFERAELSLRKALEIDPKGDWRDAAKAAIEDVVSRKAEGGGADSPPPAAAPAAAH